MSLNLTYDDLQARNSELIYYYNENAVPGRYLNKITCLQYNERPGIVMKMEVSLTNVDDVSDTKYTFWIGNNGSVFNSNPHFTQLNKIICDWVKKMRLNNKKPRLYDIGVLYPA
jgi:hypothetical protein